MSRSGAILSGEEITKAIERHRQYEFLQQVDPERQYASPFRELNLWWLKRQPRIVISSFDAKYSDDGGRLNPNSYNLTLSEKLLVYDVPAGDPGETLTAPLDMRKNNPTNTLTIPPTGLVLKPGRLYLGSTVEHTETYNLVPRLEGRSSTARLGICVHLTAGFGDCGYIGRWTTEMTVVHPVRIYPRVPLCQIVYYHIKPGTREYAGRYQNAKDVEASRFHLDTLKV